MPHVIVKLLPGRSESQKTRLAEQIVKDVVAIAKCDEESVSVAKITEADPHALEVAAYDEDKPKSRRDRHDGHFDRQQNQAGFHFSAATNVDDKRSVRQRKLWPPAANPFGTGETDAPL